MNLTFKKNGLIQQIIYRQSLNWDRLRYKDKYSLWYTMTKMRDFWKVNAIGRTSKERLGYTTQKPLSLLERIIKSSFLRLGQY